MIGKWKVRASSHIHRDKWVSLRADECVTPAGAEVSPYYVFEYPDFVHALCFDVRGQIILVRQYRHGAGELSLELPGGHIDSADPDPVSAALRELEEETGYVAGSGKLIASLTVDPAKLSNRVHLVMIHNAKPSAKKRTDETEDTETVLVPAEDLPAMALRGGMINAAHVGMVMIGLEAAGYATASSLRRDTPASV